MCVRLALRWTLRTRTGALLHSAILVAIAVTLLTACAAVPHRTGPIVKNDYSFLGEYLDWMIDQEARKAHVHGVSIAVVDGP